MELNELPERIGYDVREYRLRRGCLQGVLAELSGLNRSGIGIDNLEHSSQGLEVPAVKRLAAERFSPC